MDQETSTTSRGNEKIPPSTTSDLSDQSKAASKPVPMVQSVRPRFSSGVQAKEKLKFILGASEDNSSDEEPVLVRQPPGPQPQNTESSREHATAVLETLPPTAPASSCSLR